MSTEKLNKLLQLTESLLKDIKDTLEKQSVKDITDLDEAVKNLVGIFRHDEFEVKVFRHKWKLAKRLNISSEKHCISFAGGEFRPIVSLIVEALPGSKHLIFKVHKKG